MSDRPRIEAPPPSPEAVWSRARAHMRWLEGERTRAEAEVDHVDRAIQRHRLTLHFARQALGEGAQP